MVNDITTSQLDFLALEEVSDRAAETISGGAVVTTGLPEAIILPDAIALPEFVVEVSSEDIAGGLTIPGEAADAAEGAATDLVGSVATFVSGLRGAASTLGGALGGLGGGFPPGMGG